MKEDIVILLDDNPLYTMYLKRLSGIWGLVHTYKTTGNSTFQVLHTNSVKSFIGELLETTCNLETRGALQNAHDSLE